MSQLQLLNTTVQSLALSVNQVLTETYHACYQDAQEGDEATLIVAPLSATTEVEALYTSGVIDWESAIPAALHSLGSSAHEIQMAMQRRKKLEAETKEREKATADNELGAGKAAIEVTIAQADQTKASAEQTRADAQLKRKQAAATSSTTKPTTGGSSSSK